MAKEAEFVIHKFFTDNLCQGHEVGRVTASTNKWGPSNAIEQFVREHRPPAGKYLVTGDQGSYGSLNTGPGVFCVYTVAYPDFTIDGTRAGGIQIYGQRKEKDVQESF